MTLEDNMTLLSWGDTGARGQTGRAGGEPDQQRTESEQRQPWQRGPRDTQTGVGHPTDTEEQQPTQDRRLRAAPSHGNLTGRADQTRSAAPAGLAGRLYQQQPQRNHAQRREQQNTHKVHPITNRTMIGPQFCSNQLSQFISHTPLADQAASCTVLLRLVSTSCSCNLQLCAVASECSGLKGICDQQWGGAQARQCKRLPARSAG